MPRPPSGDGEGGDERGRPRWPPPFVSVQGRAAASRGCGTRAYVGADPTCPGTRVRLRLLVPLLALLARPAGAQAPTPAPRAAGATVSGVVHDSLARAPLAGATVQLVAAGDPTAGVRTAVSDTLGRFALDGVPDGRYSLGFLHPLLDSLGVEAPLRAVQVDGARPVRVDLAIPSPARLRDALCGARAAPEAGALLIGIVRDARDGGPAAGVRVTGEWLEMSFTREGVVRRTPRPVATTRADGWFAMCDVPSGGTMALSAGRDADSTDVLEVQVPAEGFLRRDLYLGPARTIVVEGAAARDSLAPPAPRRRYVGDGRLSGTVVAAAGGLPLAGAQVRIVDGPQTRADDRGAWTLGDAPVGTRMLEVRAVGHYPERRTVDVIAGAPPVRVALSTLKAVLDTVRITAARRVDRRLSGFTERRRTGAGRYLTPEDVLRHRPIVTSDILRRLPGVRLEPDENGIDQSLSMRGAFGTCTPAVYVDGHYFDRLSAAEIDALALPGEIAGIEIYTETSAPAQFRKLPGRAGGDDTPCGSVVIWTK